MLTFTNRQKHYGAIALSNADTKIFERTILAKITTYSSYDNFQFGFKRGHSRLCVQT